MDTIFKKDANGRERMFDIRVERLRDGTANIIKTTGLVHGKKTTSVTHVPLGYESAKKRALTIWKNKHDSGILPMLAHKWDDRKRYITEPFFVQPKLDGVRILVSNKGGISRTGKIVPGTEHWGKNLKEGEYLDGECYVHGMDFESITSAFKTEPHKLEFHVFDYYDINKPELSFKERLKYVTVETQLINTKDELQKVHDDFVARGYEGIMIRNPDGSYEPGKRSNNLLKMKMFETDEFEIIGVHEGTGRDVGTPIWECQTKSGDVFSVRPDGNMESRRETYARRSEIIGKKLTVKYQNMTFAGVPRFPVGLAIRDYE
jgi:DNA ligase-1